MAQSLPFAFAKQSKAEDHTGSERRSHAVKKPPEWLADESNEKTRKHAVWSDANGVQKISSPKTLSPELTALGDPFAGMSSSVNYKQEIERLKALVPKVDTKKRAVLRSSPSGGESLSGSRTKAHFHGRKETTGERTTASLPASRSTSRAVSPVSTPRSVSPNQPDGFSILAAAAVPKEHGHPHATEQDSRGQGNQSVISEEEKARFLQFMRSWTGGWKSWERCETDTDYNGMDSLQSGGSLWAEQLPGVVPSSSRRRSWQGPRPLPLQISRPERDTRPELTMRSEPCSPIAAHR